MRKIFVLLAVLAVQFFMVSAVQSQAACTNVAGFASNCVNNVPVLTLNNPSVSGSTVTLTANVAQSGTNIIYTTGYYWSASQNQWIQFTLTGTPYPGTNGSTWLTNSASKSLSVPTSAAINNVIYVVTWDYIFSNNNWVGPACSNPSGCWRLASFTLPAAGDTTPPSVSVSHSPTSSITPSTSIAITATASDNVGVSSIEIFVDGLSKKICTSSPCTHASTYSAGTHTYYATARDPSNNQARDPLSGTKRFTVGTAAPPGPVAAFPGAQGGGAGSMGGRGGQVIEVTNLNDGGSGSLRACIQASGPRTCVFRVAGTITPISRLQISNPYLTIAGQSAPGSGITLSGALVGGNALMFISTHNVIIRYITASAGIGTSTPGPATGNVGFELASGTSYNVVFDHVTVRWFTNKGWLTYSNDPSVTIYNITTQYMFFYESHVGHPVGPLTDAAYLAHLSTDIDFHRNLIANTGHRLPMINTKSVRWVNNIVYNYDYFAALVQGGSTTDFINNKYKAGPLNSGNGHREFGMNSAQSSNSFDRDMPGPPSVYLSGNIGPHQSNPAGDQWGTMSAYNTADEGGGEIQVPAPSGWQRFSPLATQTYPITADPVGNLDAIILPTVGNSQRLDCSGNWINKRDTADARVISEYQQGIGNFFSVEDANHTIPTPIPGTACTDSDRDGMPDAWESSHGLNPNDPSDGPRVAPNGYTNLENYLNGS